MILRVYRGGVRFSDEAALVAYVRERAIPSALSIPGLRSFQPGIAHSGEGLRLVLVSTWTEFDAILARGFDLDSPVAMPDAEDMVQGGHADHYELVLGNAYGLPLTKGTMRLTTVPLARGMEASYFDLVRSSGEGLLEQADLVAFLLGRRTVGDVTEALITTVWDDTRRDGARELLGGPAAASHHAFPPTIELFRALSVAPSSDRAPAILVADDERHFVQATRAAAQLTGHSVAGLLSMRIEDLAAPQMRDAVPDMWARFLDEGCMTGSFALQHRDGSEVPVRFSARARSPWPGTHASMLVPAGAESSADVDAGLLDSALVDAGFVSRFVDSPQGIG